MAADTLTEEKKSLSDEKARKKFDALCAELHDAGWDVIGVIRRKTPSGSEACTRALIVGADAERSFGFLSCLQHLLNPAVECGVQLHARKFTISDLAGPTIGQDGQE